MKKVLIIEIISFLFVLLFIYAAMAKLLDYEKFKVQLDQSPMLMAFSGWIAWTIPVIELVIAVMLMTSRLRLAALYASFTLMVMFTAYIVMILNFADHVPCSCGGILEKMGWTEHLFFNIGFILLAGAGVLLENGQTQMEKREESREVNALGKVSFDTNH